jgi:hypothetical protein
MGKASDTELGLFKLDKDGKAYHQEGADGCAACDGEFPLRCACGGLKHGEVVEYTVAWQPCYMTMCDNCDMR